MTEKEQLQGIAYCGLVCQVCSGARDGCPGCQAGGGGCEPGGGCTMRECCQRRDLAGCWECQAFPCDRGCFANEWRGLNIALVQIIQEGGVAALLNLLTTRFGGTVDYGFYRGMEPRKVAALLRGAPGL
jgi:hypothetical protein